LALEKKYSKHTVTAYKNDLISFSEFCFKTYNQDCIIDVQYSQIRAWIVSLVELEVSNNTINRKISSLKSFYKFLQKINQKETNPLVKHKALKVGKKIQVPFTFNEIQEVIDILGDSDDFLALRNRLIVELFYATG